MEIGSVRARACSAPFGKLVSRQHDLKHSALPPLVAGPQHRVPPDQQLQCGTHHGLRHMQARPFDGNRQGVGGSPWLQQVEQQVVLLQG